MHGHEVVGWAIDSGVSGSVDPFDTPELGPWLRHRLPEWDVLVAYRLDRLSRRVIPLNKLFGYVQEHGKTLASVSESLDLSTWIGRLVANVIAGVAEGELEAIRERNLSSQRKLKELGRWHGGTPPYGYKPERRPDGWYLIPDAEECRVLRELMLPRVLSHQSTNSIAQALNDAGIPTRTGVPWVGQVVRSILRNEATKGLVSHAEFRRVQTCLSERSVRAGDRNPNPLAGILFCYLCEAPMHSQAMSGRSYGYYRCSAHCGAKQIRYSDALGLTEEIFLREVGDLPMREKVYVPGHTDELENVRDAIAAVRREKDLGLYDGDDEGYFARLQALADRRAELEKLPQTPGWEMVDLGETYGQAWRRMGASERRAMLLRSQIRVMLESMGKGALKGHLHLPVDVRTALEQGGYP